MEPLTINDSDLMIIYSTIMSKMNLCIDAMTEAVNKEDTELYVSLADKYKILRIMRSNYLMKIAIIRENLEGVLDIAEEVRKI